MEVTQDKARILLAGAAAGQGKGGSGRSGGEGTGSGTGTGSGSGPGANAGTLRERHQRWILHFRPSRSEEYIAQLTGLGAWVAAQTPSGQYMVYRDLVSRPARGNIEDIYTLNRHPWTPDDTRLAGVLGIHPVPASMLLLLPRELDEELLEKERKAFNRKEHEISQTIFEFDYRNNRYEPIVVSQTPR